VDASLRQLCGTRRELLESPHQKNFEDTRMIWWEANDRRSCCRKLRL